MSYANQFLRLKPKRFQVYFEQEPQALSIISPLTGK